MTGIEASVSNKRRIAGAAAFTGMLLLAMLLLAPKPSDASGIVYSPSTYSSHLSYTSASSTNALASSTRITSSQTSIASVKAKISSALHAKLDQNPNAMVHYLITLVEQADTSNNIRDWNTKGWYVYNRLKEVADRTQPAVVASLSEQKRVGNVQSYERYIISDTLGPMYNLRF